MKTTCFCTDCLDDWLLYNWFQNSHLRSYFGTSHVVPSRPREPRERVSPVTRELARRPVEYGMTKPIILWQCERTESTDDAGITILRSIGPPNAYSQPGPYVNKDNSCIAEIRVPPLSYFCIKRLVQVPELVYHYGPPRPYRPPESPNDPDILQSLIPQSIQGHFNLGKVDPRLWAILVQTYSDLPQSLQTYRTALCDKYLPLLQRVPTTEHFSLLTVLELPGSSHLNDDTIVHLTALHTLCVLDASRTPLSALGIRRLSGTLKWVEDGVDCANRRRGPWQLRILSLHHCTRVTNAIFQYLESFILLAAVGKSCTSREYYFGLNDPSRSPQHELHLGPRENSLIFPSSC